MSTSIKIPHISFLLPQTIHELRFKPRDVPTRTLVAGTLLTSTLIYGMYSLYSSKSQKEAQWESENTTADSFHNCSNETINVEENSELIQNLRTIGDKQKVETVKNSPILHGKNLRNPIISNSISMNTPTNSAKEIDDLWNEAKRDLLESFKTTDTNAYNIANTSSDRSKRYSEINYILAHLIIALIVLLLVFGLEEGTGRKVVHILGVHHMFEMIGNGLGFTSHGY